MPRRSRRITEVADGVFQLTPVPGINCWVALDDDGATLIDTGLESSQDRLVSMLRRLGISLHEIRRVLLTHSHPDHAGGAAHLLTLAGDVDVRAGKADVGVVRGEVEAPPPDQSTRSGRLFARLPDFLTFSDAPPVPSAQPLADGDEVDVKGGIVAVATPGHTAGHLAYHLPDHDLVIGGDAVFNIWGLRPCPAITCADVARNRESIGRLATVGADTLLLAHGRPVTRDVAGRLRELVMG